MNRKDTHGVLLKYVYSRANGLGPIWIPIKHFDWDAVDRTLTLKQDQFAHLNIEYRNSKDDYRIAIAGQKTNLFFCCQRSIVHQDLRIGIPLRFFEEHADYGNFENIWPVVHINMHVIK